MEVYRITGFRRRTGLHSDVRHGEAASGDSDVAEQHREKFKKKIEEVDFVSQQVMYWDETVLFWNRMPRRIHFKKEEITLPGHKPMMDRFTLLFCANVSKDCKVKPLLVCHSENPRTFENIRKNRLGVLWRSNHKAWVTRNLSSD